MGELDFDYGNMVPSGTQVDELHKAKGEATPAKKVEVQVYDGPVFRTTIKNARDSEAMLQTDAGSNWLLLPPGKEIVLCSWSNRTMYCPYSRVVFEKNGKVSVTRRFGFKDPVESEPYSILLNNRDGAPLEVVRIMDEYHSAIQGLPRRVKITLHDPLVGYREIRWVKKVVKVPAPGNKNYLLTKEIIEKQMLGRKASELRAIRKEIEKRAVEDARKSADRAFKRIQPAEGEDETPSAE